MADATTKAKRKPAGPKSFYLVYAVNGAGDDIVEHCFSRKTDEVLTAMSDNPGAKVKKLTAAPGR